MDGSTNSLGELINTVGLFTYYVYVYEIYKRMKFIIVEPTN